MRDRKIKSIALSGALWGFAIVAMSFACAPPTERISRPPGELKSGPRLEDVDLKIGETNARVSTRLRWQADVSAAVAFRMIENLLAIEGGPTAESRSEWGQAIVQGLPHTQANLADSAYADLIIDKTRASSTTMLARNLPKVRAVPTRVREILAHLPAPIPSGEKNKMKLAEVPGYAFSYLDRFEQAVAVSGLMRQAVEMIEHELGTYRDKRKPIEKAVEDLSSAKTIRSALDQTEAALRVLDSHPTTELKAKFEKGRALASKVDGFRDEAGAFSVLIDVWQYLEPSERGSVFKAANPALYDYFAKLSPGDFECVRNAGFSCLSDWVAQQTVIFPKLKEYGLDRLRGLINAKGADAVREQVRQVIITQMNKMPDLIAEKVEASVKRQIAPLEKLEKDVGSEVRSRFTSWAKASIEKNGPSVFAPRATAAGVTLNEDGVFDIKWSDKDNDSMENRGALSALITFLWQRAGLSSDVARSLALSNIVSLSSDYLEVLKRKSQANAGAEKTYISARGFAETVRGYSAAALAFHELSRNRFDSFLGGFNAQDLFPEFSLPELNRALFPRQAFFALSFAGLSDKIKLVNTADKTQLFLIDAKNRVTLANDQGSESGSPTVMAGIRDRNGDELATTVRAEDISRFLIAMCQMLEATRAVELSKSEYLLSPMDTGRVPRDEIVEARSQIRQLILGLANYLSHQFRTGGDLVWRELVVNTQKPYDRNITVLDQALAIRALIAASDALGTEIYRWEAIDLLAAMNKSLFRKDLGFYARQDDTQISPPVLLETLRALDAIAPHLKLKGRRQIELLAAPWRETIASWKILNPNSSRTQVNTH